MILNFGGKSTGLSFFLFMLGYYVFYENQMMQKLKKVALILLGLGLTFTVANIAMFIWAKNVSGSVNLIVSKLSMWFMMLGVLGLFAQFFDKSNSISRYLSANSFLFYQLHYVWLLIFQLMAFELTGEYVFSTVFALLISYAATFLNVGLVKRIPLVRTLFGAK